ncbi:LacI family transcriptional regulator [Microbacterium sp. W4I4]|uniref:LacI family DNA-binding transcriptional regulator n=1 Tax=Microbacterium sp. W4I4 TaxID=3042295 RepID=UPI002782FD89|nr:LacI family DNA-binding transcriptional regulator [Microbacterium sp. W4I4]MDQ0615335.1 LacI family transcriptional regulator [Microbacterium sp. W4I4]
MASDKVGDRAGRRVRLQDVADAAGVSLAQASGALSGYRDVNEATRQRVRDVADRLGYAPSAHARLLGSRGRASTRCAIVMSGASDPASAVQSYRIGTFLSGMLDGALLRAAELGLDIRLIRVTDEEIATGSAFRTLLARDGADAVVVQTFTDLLPEHIEPLRKAGLPFVLLNRHFDGDPDVDAVVADVRAGITDAVSRLVSRGHHELRLVVGEQETSVVRDYCRGWEEATKKHGVSATSGILRYDHSDVSPRIARARELLPSEGSRPTAIVAVDDLAAYDLLRRAEELGLSIPGDLEIITFQSTIAPFTSPPMSAYDLHLEEMGAAAIDKVAAALGLGHSLKGGHLRYFAPAFLPRRSTGDAIS